MRGIYSLIFDLPQVSVYRWRIDKGVYTYIGSALREGLLNSRIRRHLFHPKKVFWHIDHITTKKIPYAVVYAYTKNKMECKLSRVIEKDAVAIKGFGSSDCKCKSHLYRLDKNKIDSIIYMEELYRYLRLEPIVYIPRKH
ncbi:MAG: DUF123 domain-containing protein [Candidatus Hydrothermarchaeota archaeon]